jgi:deoxycytidylate deaminase
MCGNTGYKFLENIICICRKPSLQQNVFIQEAEKLALKSLVIKRHGCVIVQNNKIVGKGYNKLLEKNKNSMKTLHAEVSALNDIKKNNIILKQADIYIVRISTDGTLFRISSPCINCQNHIKKFQGIKNIYFTTDFTLK